MAKQVSGPPLDESFQISQREFEYQDEKLFLNRCCSSGSLSATSDYCSSYDDQSVRRPNMKCQNKEAEGRRASLADEPLTEEDACNLSKDISQHYKELAMELKLTQAEIREIEDEKNGRNSNREKALAVLTKFMQKKGRGATKGDLAFALHRAGRLDIAEKIIGNADFLGKKKHRKTFILLKEESYLHCDSFEKKTISICEDQDGSLFRLEKLEGPKLQQYLKWKNAVSKQGSTVSDFGDPKRKEELEDVQELLRTLEKDLKEIQHTLERQERQEDQIKVGLQLDEDEKLLDKMHNLAHRLVRQADALCQLEEPFVPKSQIYDVSISLSAVAKDLEERVKTLLKMIISDEEALRLNKLLARCLSLRNVIEEKISLGSLKDLTHQARQRKHLPSAPTPSSRVSGPEDSKTTRLNTMPKSEREQRELEKQIKPKKDPLEVEEEVWSTRF
ncbi:uncharacterized protein LOC116287686 isoform X2 [Actinia tenebrosa]|uniref:Uncharacterized protein LOC116287686 isoform X2 n=1 Tax=Actinia tenebrosa TaxID=6105 RepID=A0A6P8HC31_ACTTE|nr:uncharacterized protein LOC116287686 isoform X2 [Actinia tenebrosa]